MSSSRRESGRMNQIFFFFHIYLIICLFLLLCHVSEKNHCIRKKRGMEGGEEKIIEMKICEIFV